MTMFLFDEEKESIIHKFDSYCKKILYHTAINYNKKSSYLYDHESPVLDLLDDTYSMVYTDDYFTQDYYFEVLGEIILVKGDDIARILNVLPGTQRKIILLYYFTGMTDAKIGARLNMSRQNVQSHRTMALKSLRKLLEGDNIE